MRFLIIILISLCVINCTAQGLYNRQWIIGEPNVTLTFNQNSNGQFSYVLNSTLVNPPYLGYKLSGNGVNSICDSATGLVEFYTNGIHIYNANAQVFDNDDSLISPYNYQRYVALNNIQGTLILPKGNKKYDVFFPYHSDSIKNPVLTGADLFLHHVINMNLNNGLGSITIKKQDLLNGMGNITFAGMDAVKHANGIDWWILKPGFGKGLFGDSMYLYTWLVKPDTVLGPMLYYCGDSSKNIFAALNYTKAQLKFSLDGTKFAGTCGSKYIYCGDFNRCTGVLSNFKTKHIPWDSSYVLYGDTTIYYESYLAPSSFGINISPNNKYIYMIAGDGSRIWQYEYNELDSINAWYRIVRSKDTINTMSGLWGSLEYAPDSVLLIFTHSGGTCKGFISAILNPNDKGVGSNYKTNACSFAPGQIFPCYNTPAYHPNYNLGMDSSLCWPLSITAPAVVKPTPFTIYPNPATNTVHIAVVTIYKQPLIVYNTAGQKVYSKPIKQLQTTIDVSKWPSGTYMVHYNGAAKQLVVE